MHATPPPSPELMLKFIRRTVLSLLALAAILFGAAGTFDWPQAWIYLGFTAVLSIAGGFWLARRDPALLAERLGSLIQREQKGWDKLLMGVMTTVWIAWLILMGLDVKRFGWSHVPLALQVVGFALLCLGSYLVFLTFKANSYAAPVVKIQKERGHAVATTGPYACVRHPMYAGALLFVLGAPLLLGSWWGLAAVLVVFPIIATRAVLEERTLGAELEGYADYARRVRFRIVPYVW
jgi:protein-S-isoprenylcysteine O-methyltransferase Ste14